MKTSARFLAVLVAVLMLATAALTVSASFSDVEDGYDYAPAIATLSQLEVIGGYEDGTFKPNNNVERDEMAKLIYVLYTTFVDAGAGSVKFSDVPAGNWATGYISWCSAKSIVGGYEDGNFRPDNNISYDEALKMVCCVLGYTEFKSELWPTDVRQTGLKTLKLGAGLEDVKGSDKLTRGQVAQLLYNALFANMKETTIEYVEDTSLLGPNGPVMVPVERAKVLAKDIWAFGEKTVRVVGTKNFAFYGAVKANGTDPVAKANEDDAILLATYDGTKWVADEAATSLADLGLDAYNKNTDALIGLDIKIVEKDGKALAKASVLGSVKTAEVVNDGTNEDKVKIDGVLYDNTNKNNNKFSDLKVLAYDGADVKVVDSFQIQKTDAGKIKLEYPHTAVVIDHEGDGVVDAIAIDYAKLAVVTNVGTNKYTITTELNKVFDDDDTTTPATTDVSFTAVADAKTLAKGDVFVYSVINAVYYIDEVITPVSAGVSKITAGDTAAITLDGIGAVRYVDNAPYFLGGANVTFNASELLTDDAEPQDYYIYNDFVVFTTGTPADEVVESYNIALLLYTEKPSDAVIVDNKYIKNYPATLLIDGKSVKVNVKTIDGVAPGVKVGEGSAAHEKWEEFDMDNVGDYAQPSYTLVTYTVNEDGTYAIKTTGQGNIGDTVVVATGNTITINTNTGLFAIDGKKFELTDSSVIYCVADDDNTDEDATTKLTTYTKANLIKNFSSLTTSQATYLVKVDDYTYALLATVINAKPTAPDAGGNQDDATYKTDARLIKYVPVGPSSVRGEDGKAYYEYTFFNWDTLTNDSPVINTALTISGGATPVEAGNFYGWDASAKKYVKVTTSTEGLTSVVKATISRVDAGRGLVYISGDNLPAAFADGFKLPEGAKIVASSAANAWNTYTTFDINTLADLAKLASDNSKTINVAIGTYTENSTTKLAWMVIDNYYMSGETCTQAADLVSKIAP